MSLACLASWTVTRLVSESISKDQSNLKANSKPTGISGLSEPAPIHPGDRPLFKAASQLGKQNTASGMPFLRRTEVLLAADSSSRRPDPTLKRPPPVNAAGQRKRPRTEDAALNNPKRIARDIARGFHTANGGAPVDVEPLSKRQAEAWAKPLHPENPKRKLLDVYPFVPDLDAVPDLGSFTVAKFQTNPLGSADFYDPRLDIAVLRPKEPSREKVDDYNLRKAAFEMKPDENPDPGQPLWDYELFLVENKDDVAVVREQIAADAGETSGGVPEGERAPRNFVHLRAYETQHQTGDMSDPFGDHVAIALHNANDADDDDDLNRRVGLAQGAYVYPIAQRTTVRPSRGQDTNKHMPPPPQGAEEADVKVDVIELTLRPPNEQEIEVRARAKDMYTAAAPAAAAAAVASEA